MVAHPSRTKPDYPGRDTPGRLPDSAVGTSPWLTEVEAGKIGSCACSGSALPSLHVTQRHRSLMPRQRSRHRAHSSAPPTTATARRSRTKSCRHAARISATGANAASSWTGCGARRLLNARTPRATPASIPRPMGRNDLPDSAVCPWAASARRMSG